MGYRIEYHAIGPGKRNRNRKWGKVVAAMLVIFFVAGAIVMKAIGLTWVQEVLLPGDPAITAAALDVLAEDLRSGDSLYDAIKAFCQEIMENAEQFP